MLTLIRSLRGANARNWPGVIILDPDAPFPAAVWAQERYEAGWKLNPLNLLRRNFSAEARRDMEIMGHEIEVQAAVRVYGQDERKYRRSEARALMGYRDFRGIPEDRIVKDMKACTAEAVVFVERHMDEILERT